MKHPARTRGAVFRHPGRLGAGSVEEVPACARRMVKLWRGTVHGGVPLLGDVDAPNSSAFGIGEMASQFEKVGDMAEAHYSGVKARCDSTRTPFSDFDLPS